MKLLRKLLTLGAFALVMGTGSVALAADAAPGAKALKDLVLKGDAKCTQCHDEADDPKLLSIGKTRHGVKADGRNPTCTDCHGDSEKHLTHKGKDKPPKPDRYFAKNSTTPAEERNEACLTCHKGDKRTHWEGSQHESRGVACTSCHQVHAQHDKVRDKKTQAEVCFTCHKTEKALTHRMSTHPLDAGKMSCSDCHNAHGSVGPKLLLKASVSETCYTCHTEKRGPFLWEHTPVVDDCLNCHTPHGSNNPPLLKVRAPWMCEQCHQNTGAGGHYGYFDANSLPGGKSVTGANVNSASATNPLNPVTNQLYKSTSVSPRLAYRGCVDCHSQIHGSNHPAGSRFVR